MTDTITVGGLHYIYPDGTRALNGIDFSVIEGESVALVGKNGAGKSTLLLHLNGIFSPTRGRVLFQGKEINEKNVHDVRVQIGLVFQDPDDQLFMPTVEEDVAFGPLNMGLSYEEVTGRTKKALSLVGLSGFEDRSLHYLSFGEKKKAAIATILSMNPKILLLDEPTLGLDPWARKDFFKLLKGLFSEHTVVVATHDLDLAKLCGRLYLMKSGKLEELPEKKIII